jgi:lipoate-protein ligase B
MPIDALPEGTDYFEIERGGDLTWHGPGQLVVYPIVKLDGRGFGPNHDVTKYLRKLEAVFGGWLAGRGLVTEARENATGIWVVPTSGPARKIASIGIAVRKWVTYHGIGLNLANARDGFRAISPCGFDPSVMTTLAAESPEFKGSGWSEAVRGGVEAEMVAAISPGAILSIREV